MEKSRPYLQLVIDNPAPLKKECRHSSITPFVESSSGDTLSYMCDYCKAKFATHQVGIFQDAFGYADYYAISE